MHDVSKFLLRDIVLSPYFSIFRQERVADQRRQLLVARRHLLQRRIGIREPERAGSARILSGKG